MRGVWLLIDLALVAFFAVVGRLSHYGTLTAGGWWSTAWPFLAGTVLAWLVLVAARRRPASLAFGAGVWLVTLVAGMLLRQASGQGTATSFVVVATVVLGALLLAPRLLVRVSSRGARG